MVILVDFFILIYHRCHKPFFSTMETRKERSKLAARERREKEAELFAELQV